MAAEPVRGIQAQMQTASQFSPEITTELVQQRMQAVINRARLGSDAKESPDRMRAETMVQVPTEKHNQGLVVPRFPHKVPDRKAPGSALGKPRKRPRNPWSGRSPGAGEPTTADKTRRPQTWNVGLAGKLLVDDLVRETGLSHAAAKRVVGVPVYNLERAEVVALSNTPVSTRTRARMVRELTRVAVALERRGDPQVAGIARAMAEKLPGNIDAYAVKMLWDLTNRLPRAEDAQLQEAEFHAPEVSTTGENDLIREAAFGFEHNGTNTTGYKFYFSATPPSGSEFVADHEFDVGYLHPSADGERKHHFEDAGNVLNSDARYYVWTTAYNDTMESPPSNVIHENFPAARRGDLNRDGVIDTADMDALMRVLLGEADAIALADVNADGWVTQADVEALIAKMS